MFFQIAQEWIHLGTWIWFSRSCLKHPKPLFRVGNRNDGSPNSGYVLNIEELGSGNRAVARYDGSKGETLNCPHLMWRRKLMSVAFPWDLIPDTNGRKPTPRKALLRMSWLEMAIMNPSLMTVAKELCLRWRKGTSEPTCGSRFQTATSRCGQEPGWWALKGKVPKDGIRWESRGQM